MTFKVPASKADLPQNRYKFECEVTEVDEKDGERVISKVTKTFDVPKLGFIDGALVESLVEAAQFGNLAWQSACYDLFGAADTESGQAVRALPSDSFEALRADYFKASNLTVGESSASDDS